MAAASSAPDSVPRAEHRSRKGDGQPSGIPHRMRIDIVCRVIDNFGDAGVTWRLARQLVAEHGAEVRLWIDRPATLARMAPGLACLAAPLKPAPGVAADGAASVDGVEVRPLHDGSSAPTLAEVVIEGFGCGLPAPWRAAMAVASRAPVWINLEYLSAEPWIDGVHGLPSPQPRLPLTRYFYFPGFTPKSGGLLRERDLLARREAAAAGERDSPSGLPPFLHTLVDAGALDPRIVGSGTDADGDTGTGAGMPSGGTGSGTAAASVAGADMDARGRSPRPLLASLFCYDNGALPGLLGAWSRGPDPLLLLLPEGIASDAVGAWLGAPPPPAGQSASRGRLTIAGVPFLAQDDYDRLLWACDLNLVRGEDSFVRAQWAARPFVWHIYPQAEGAHHAKLDAFLDRYLAHLEDSAAGAARVFWQAWNEGDPAATANAWGPFRSAFPALLRHGEAWARELASEADLASRLMQFCLDRL